MGDVMKEAAFSLAEAKFATGDFNQVVLQNVTKAQIKIRTKKDNVAGVTLPVFESYQVIMKIPTTTRSKKISLFRSREFSPNL